jgi:ferrous iron transport protein B
MSVITQGYREKVEEILALSEGKRRGLSGSPHEFLIQSLYKEAQQIAENVVKFRPLRVVPAERKIDRYLTSPILGFPLMFLLLGAVFWLTIVGANYPSEMLARALFWVEGRLEALFSALGAPWWVTGFFVHGVYRGLAWVVSVMLPPMAIFFPCFTLLEDLGYLPRVAFNLDKLFKKVGAHGKQALTMGMGFGCNAAGVISCRIINSPRERLIAILTNNFMPCNGRWPTLIMLATLFVAAGFPASVGALVGAGVLVGLVVFGVLVTLGASWLLSRTVLRGEPSYFVLELPPYRKPQILRVLYTSFIDRTIFVLWRAIIMAAPCGGIAWILGNVHWGDVSWMRLIANALDPLGRLLGLDGVILLAYIVAIPANEIVVPTILMGYLSADRMMEIENLQQLRHLLVVDNGWTVLTAVCLMLFSLLHNPCSTTLITIYKETGSKKWTLIAALLPLSVAFLICFLVAQIGRALMGG